ncbi:MAG: 50S ribosomal protein L25/general stress protein Ctc [Alphaproteobacteria bacterium]|nr:50S ribosomal protein L25/general stress protein Ctc [Alphaproteobacteria bacterium]
MSTQVQKVKAEVRERAGKGNARAVRAEGRVPAVVYGGKEAPVMISLEEKVIVQLSQKSGFFTHLMDIDANGKAIRVIPRDVQYDPVTDRVVHVDFLRVTAGTLVRVFVPVVFINQDKSPGLKRGGALNVVQHQIQLSCSPEKIPEKITVDLEGKNIGDTIHLEDIKLPADVTPILGAKDTTIASVAAPTVVKEEETTTAAATTDAAAAPAAGAAGAAPAAAAAGAKPGAAPAAAPAAAKAPAKK